MPQLNSEDFSETLDLSQSASILRKHWLPSILVASSVLGGTVMLTNLQDPIYEAKGQILFNKQNRVSTLATAGSNVDKLSELSGLTQSTNPLDTEAEILRSPPSVIKTIDALNLQDPTGKPLKSEAFLRSLKVKSVKGTDILELTYRSPNPQEAAKIINTLMSIYLSSNVTTSRAEATAARTFIDQQLKEVEAQVSDAEAKLRQFKEANQVIVLPEESKATVEALSKLSDQITTTEANLRAADQRSRTLQSELGLSTQQGLMFTALRESTAVQQVLEEYRQTQNQLVVQRTRYQEVHPEIEMLVNKEQALRQQLELRVAEVVGNNASITTSDLQLTQIKQTLTADLIKAEVDRLGLAQQVATLQQARQNFQQRAGALPKLEQTQSELERRLQVARLTYEQLLKRLKEVEIIENQNVGNARIISEATPPDVSAPVAPKKNLNWAIGGVLGLIMGLLTAPLLELIDKSIKTVDAAHKALRYPLLGTIPRFDKHISRLIPRKASQVPVLDAPYSGISTAYEMLYTNLGFTLSDKALQVLVVTSSVRGEGKSTVVANLGAIASQLGRRVLIIDADLRAPDQHKIWAIPNIRGVSDILVNQSEFGATPQAIREGFDIITAGTIPPNPAVLLDSRKFASLIEQARQAYDFVILDTPPLTVADALPLGKVADGVLMVIRPGIVDTVATAATQSLLEHSQQPVLGMVVNGVICSNESSRYYNYANRQYHNRTESESLSGTPSEPVNPHRRA